MLCQCNKFPQNQNPQFSEKVKKSLINGSPLTQPVQVYNSSKSVIDSLIKTPIIEKTKLSKLLIKNHINSKSVLEKSLKKQDAEYLKKIRQKTTTSTKQLCSRQISSNLKNSFSKFPANNRQIHQRLCCIQKQRSKLSPYHLNHKQKQMGKTQLRKRMKTDPLSNIKPYSPIQRQLQNHTQYGHAFNIRENKNGPNFKIRQTFQNPMQLSSFSNHKLSHDICIYSISIPPMNSNIKKQIKNSDLRNIRQYLKRTFKPIQLASIPLQIENVRIIVHFIRHKDWYEVKIIEIKVDQAIFQEQKAYTNTKDSLGRQQCTNDTQNFEMTFFQGEKTAESPCEQFQKFQGINISLHLSQQEGSRVFSQLDYDYEEIIRQMLEFQYGQNGIEVKWKRNQEKEI